MVTLDDIRDAAERLEPVLRFTPVEHVHAVSSAARRDVWVKEEQLQRSGSYKIRGAYNFVSRLDPGRPVVAASDGNHAQGVALAANMCGNPCELFIPRTVALSKVQIAEAYGATVTPVDGDVQSCEVLAKECAAESGGAFVPGFDDPLIIAGAGTVGLELAEQMPESVDTVVVPVGGGGLASGIAVALKALRPRTRVIGVEAAGAPAMSRSLREGKLVHLDRMPTMADCNAMPSVSQLTLDHVREHVDKVVLVTEAEISNAILILLERAKVVIEPGAAASLAGVLSGEVPGDGSVCTVLSGGNVDPVLLMKLIDHGLTTSGRFLVVQVVMPDAPGHLAELTRRIATMGINVLDIQHHRSGHSIEANQVQVEITIEARSRDQHEQIVHALEGGEYEVEIMN